MLQVVMTFRVCSCFPRQSNPQFLVQHVVTLASNPFLQRWLPRLDPSAEFFLDFFSQMAGRIFSTDSCGLAEFMHKVENSADLRPTSKITAEMHKPK